MQNLNLTDAISEAIAEHTDQQESEYNEYQYQCARIGVPVDMTLNEYFNN